VMKNKRSELANILRQLADYIDRQPDQDLDPIFERAAMLMHTAGSQKKSQAFEKREGSPPDVKEIAARLRRLPSRDAGEELLQSEFPSRRSLETLARLLQLPVQRDDTVQRLRAKIVENTIGSRLRADAIQG